MDLRSVLERLTRELRDAGIDHALIGGLALATHGVVRATADLDLLVDGDRSDDVHRILTGLGYDCLHRSEHAANYASDDPERGRVDFLFARREYGRAMLLRARPDANRSDDSPPVVDAADLIGLKVQASSNDPGRRRLDLADIQRLLKRAPELDLDRVREYFRLFDREKELEALLEEIRR
jgi:hypothetical protein